MRQSDGRPIDPEVLAELEAIDATLAGEAVDPIHAELAEMALLLAAGRPPIRTEFARSLDGRVSRRFAREDSSDPTWVNPARRPWWRINPTLATAAGLLAVGVAVVIALPGGSSSSSYSSSSAALNRGEFASSSASAAATASSSSASGGVSAGRTRGHEKAPAGSSLTGAGPTAAHKSASPGALQSVAATTPNLVAAPSTGQSPTPAPDTHGRKTIQSAQLQLLATATRIDTVSQELFTVVGVQNGIVKRSVITAAGANNGEAFFVLSIPSANLATTMTQLSELHFAHVASRTDSSTDVNGQYISDQRQLADARALRTALLKQLAAATTETAITSITAQIHDAEASISSDEATVRGVNNQVDYSSLSVTINAGSVPVPVSHHRSTGTGGFTLGTAAHDAGRVLTIATGVVLIALAVLLPIGLLAALGAWIAYWVRRRRRDQALDIA